MRAVEDDHVDRPGVEVRQCMKLTGTNSSIGLIVLINHMLIDWSDDQTVRPDAQRCDGPIRSTACIAGLAKRDCSNKKAVELHQLLIMLRFADLVVMAGWLHPFPFRTRP